MRLLIQNDQIIAQFNVLWELSQLLDRFAKGIEWAEIYIEGKKVPIGRVHTTTPHEVKLFEGNSVKHRQVVRLGPESHTS